jgi:hypothetical protein
MSNLEYLDLVEDLTQGERSEPPSAEELASIYYYHRSQPHRQDFIDSVPIWMGDPDGRTDA